MAKLSQNSPLAAKGGKKWKTKTKQQAHSTILPVPPNYAATSPSKVHAPLLRPHAQAGKRRPAAYPHTPASAGVRLRVYLLQHSPTQRHSCCGVPLNPTTSRPASAAPPAAGEPEAATLSHPGDCTGFLQAARSWLASPRSNDTPGAEGRGGPGGARGRGRRGRAWAGEIGRERGMEGGRKPGGGVGQLRGRPF